jgi:transposase
MPDDLVLDQVVALLAQASQPCTADSLRISLQVRNQRIVEALRQLSQQGKVVRLPKGYVLLSNSTPGESHSAPARLFSQKTTSSSPGLARTMTHSYLHQRVPEMPNSRRTMPTTSATSGSGASNAQQAPTDKSVRLRPDATAKILLKTATNGPKHNIYSLRIEYAPGAAGNFPIKDADLWANWSREFTVSGKYTLEQLSGVVIDILDWDSAHLYEFRIHNQVYAHMVFLSEDDLVVDAQNRCVSCDIPIRLLGLAASDTFAYIFDYGDYHVFRITVLDVRSAVGLQSTPKLVSHTGKNIIQYPGTLRRADARAFQKRIPSVRRPEPSSRYKWRIRFIRGADKEILDEWRASNDKKLWQKAVTILENRNVLPERIASKIERPIDQIEKWITEFNRYGLDGLNRPRKPRRKAEREAARDQKARRILEILHAKPTAYGINRSNWNIPSIARAYEQEHKEIVGKSSVGRLLKQFGFAIRKARKVLTSPDPEYREKVELLLNTLQNLKPGELFFFVDELGPLRVKKYGGRALVRKNEVLLYPQEQPHRGIIMMSGALSATTNQVTWIYGRSKDTSAMIDLIEVLYNQYFSASRLYVTWDAASWHRSAGLVEWLDVFNATTRNTGEGPIIQLVPLPTSSQFLDVIEAVFSGMKRAVVHHSDYRNVPEMKKAISLHFADRNSHFQDNPKRAGKKIWDLDFFDDTENIRSGNYREW